MHSKLASGQNELITGGRMSLVTNQPITQPPRQPPNHPLTLTHHQKHLYIVIDAGARMMILAEERNVELLRLVDAFDERTETETELINYSDSVFTLHCPWAGNAIATPVGRPWWTLIRKLPNTTGALCCSALIVASSVKIQLNCI